MKKEKQYCVYAHVYEGSPFYIGSGTYYRDNISKGRAFDFIGRSPEWFNYCKNETYKVMVHILFITDNKQESFNMEEQFTIFYLDQKAPLVNKFIGTKTPKEWLKIKKSNGYEVLITNNQTQDTRAFSSIKEAYNFITKEGYTKIYTTLRNNLKKGPYNFGKYTLERIK